MTKISIRTCLFLLPCFAAPGLHAKTYHIDVSFDGVSVTYRQDDGKGLLGHQIASQNDNIIWECDNKAKKGSCNSVAVQFKSGAPCTLVPKNGQVTCSVKDTSFLAFYAYNIAVSYDGGTVLTDPEVIVDNSGDQQFGLPRAAPKKKK